MYVVLVYAKGIPGPIRAQVPLAAHSHTRAFSANQFALPSTKTDMASLRAKSGALWNYLVAGGFFVFRTSMLA